MDDKTIDSTGLGVLARLPFELRSIIWDFVVGDVPTHRRDSLDSNTSFGLLRNDEELEFELENSCSLCEDDIETCDERLDNVLAVSDNFNDEVVSALHDKQIACFVLSTSCNMMGLSDTAAYRSNSLIARLPHSYLDFNGYNCASQKELRHFISIPWKLFKTIKIEMEAPQDAADIIRLWNHIIGICDALFMVKSLPAIEIHARNSGDGARKWDVDGVLKKSVPWPAFFEENARLRRTILPVSDLELLLSPFRRLSNARSAKVFLPSGISDSRLKRVVKQIENFVIKKHIFRHENDFSDLTHWILSEEDERTAILDVVLDDLDGQNARMVRLQRFMTLNKRYFHNIKYRTIGTCYKDVPSGPWPTRGNTRWGVHMDIEHWALSALTERRIGWRAFRQAWPDRLAPSTIENAEQVIMAYGSARLFSAILESEHFDKTEPFNLEIPDWRAYYPAGIPKKSSDEYANRVKEYQTWDRMERTMK